ncbi:MAG: Uma2 family endonuclease [Gemmatimonadota bacterium]|nr:Uma2 family endonuclease [Gemmatimonadota bacterium]
MATQQDVWTPDLIRRLGGESRHWPRYECIDGELLVTVAPRVAHQAALAALFRLLDPYVRGHALGELLWSPSEITLDPNALVQPDLFVIPRAAARPIGEWKEVTSLLLAVEVLSPSTARRDRGLKRLYYQRTHVPEYWIVDLDSRLVERWRPGDDRPEIVSETLVWQPADEHAPLEIALQAMFEKVEGLAGASGG